ncbi:MAG: ATP synthase subunit delta [SAR116 cluster bacterium]|nr:MAG: ATP synthase subunit delta [SAR116 cluster bacterium]
MHQCQMSHPIFIPVDEGTSLSSSAKGLAGRYAGALYALAEESGKIDAVVKDMNGVAELVSANQDMRMLVESPAITWAEQTKAVTAVLEKGGADTLTVKFVGTVASNGRLHALSRIISAFLAEHARRRGEVSAEVISAVEMDDARRARVEQAVSKLAGSDKLSLSMRVDPSLIGGLVVRIGSRMIDTSIRTKLNRLETAMKGVA